MINALDGKIFLCSIVFPFSWENWKQLFWLDENQSLYVICLVHWPH